jgi:hypothetical protein
MKGKRIHACLREQRLHTTRIFPNLTATVNDGLEAHTRPPPHVERTNTLRSVHLVAADAQQVNVHRVHVDRNLADRLRRVRVKVDLARAAHAADLGHRLNDADLIVDEHARHERRVGPNRGLELSEVHEAVALHGQVGHVEALELKLPTRVEHAFVLGLCAVELKGEETGDVNDNADGDEIRCNPVRPMKTNGKKTK